ncbi:hypothetical protein ATS75_04495 [Pseudoalteromonas sp. H105]|nr:hypothetical protein ATS75_04495 [Pseudoalteromonas sp. H105]
MSVDPLIQSPGNSQSINPYSYIMNNPLAGTDPTGYAKEELTKIEHTKTTEKVAVTGSRIKRTVTTDVSGTATFTTGNGATKTQSFSATYSGGKVASMDIGSQKNIAQKSGEGNGGTNQSQISVTGSAEESTSAKLSVPSKDVLGTKEMDSQATEIINNFESGGTKEQGILVDKSGKHIEPESCNNKGCSFDSPKNIRFVAHSHVESNHPHSGMAEATTKKREMPGPGDHSFLVKKNAPNYFRTPSGVIKVLEYKGGQYQVRTLSTGSISPNWNPSDANLSRREIKKALKR